MPLQKNKTEYQGFGIDFENIASQIFKLNLFESAWYTSVYSIIIPELSYTGTIDEKLLKHYLYEGWKEGFDPCKNFSTSLFLADYSDVKSSGICPLVHYVKYGIKEGRVPCKHKPFPNFSIIMATRNRVDRISNAINSALGQKSIFGTRYELIIVDDGSTDGTSDYITNEFSEEIKQEKIVLISISHKGVSAARNVGVSKARYEWVCYLDDDNLITSDYLETFTKAIIKNAESQFFYAQHYLTEEKKITEHSFNRSQLLDSNFIDLGVICHTRIVFDVVGGFDENLGRLVDWDLIIRITSLTPAVYIPKIVMEYSSKNNYQRISNTVSLEKNLINIKSKYYRERQIFSVIDNVSDRVDNLSTNLNIFIKSTLCTQIIKYKILKFITFGKSHRKFKKIYKALVNLKKSLDVSE